MVGNEHLRMFKHFRWCVVDDHLTVFVHQLVFGRSFHGEFFQVRGISLYIDTLTGNGKDRLFGIIGENEDERTFFLTRKLMGESSTVDLDGVNTIDDLVRTVYIQLTLVKVEESSFYLETVTTCTARHQYQGECDDIQESLHTKRVFTITC